MTQFGRIQIADRLALDENLSTGITAFTTEVALPVDFSVGTTTTVTSRTVSGGALGANGFIEFTGFGVYACTGSAHGVTATLSVSATTTAYVVSPNMPTGVINFFELRASVQNTGSESSNLSDLMFNYGPQVPGAGGGNGTGRFIGAPSLDSRNDWTFALSIKAATGDTILASVQHCWIRTQYIP